MKAKSIVVATLLLVLFSACQNKNNTTGHEPSSVIAKANIIDLLKKNQIDTLAKGFTWSEGPLWIESIQSVIFSDVPENIVYSYSQQNGVQEYLKPSGYTGNENRQGSNGLVMNNDGQLVLCQHGDRRVALMDAPLNDPKPVFKTVTSHYDTYRFNSPNDATYSKKGDLFFTDPPYGLPADRVEELKEYGFYGVFKHTVEGETVLLIDSLTAPNGIAISPDQTKLYVANSDPKKAIWMEYGLDENFNITSGKVFFDATDRLKTMKGNPDGLEIMPDGTIFATGPGGVLIFSPQGELLHTIETGQETANCAFNTDYTYLYITADDYLMGISLQ